MRIQLVVFPRINYLVTKSTVSYTNSTIKSYKEANYLLIFCKCFMSTFLKIDYITNVKIWDTYLYRYSTTKYLICLVARSNFVNRYKLIILMFDISFH